MMMRGISGTGLCLIALGSALVCGCAGPRSNDAELDALLAGLETTGAVLEETAADSPEPPSGGRPPADIAGRSEELTIQPNSLVHVKVAEDSTLNGSYSVNEIGAIEFGYVGPVTLYNMTALEAARKIKQTLESRFFRKGKASVTVQILRPSYDKIMVAGAVNKPGMINIGAGENILLNDALRRAGGVRVSATGARVRIVRNGLESALVFSLPGDVYSLVDDDGAPRVPETKLRNNDFVYVFAGEGKPESGMGMKRIVVLGEVKRQGVYTFSADEPCTIMHLIFKMGPLPRYANSRKIAVYRRNEAGREDVIDVDANAILETGDPSRDVELCNGDRVKIPARRLTIFR